MKKSRIKISDLVYKDLERVWSEKLKISWKKQSGEKKKEEKIPGQGIARELRDSRPRRHRNYPRGFDELYCDLCVASIGLSLIRRPYSSNPDPPRDPAF